MLKRLSDILFSFFGILILSPLFIVFSILILFDSKGGVFYRQIRVGKGSKDFLLFKFRTMYLNSDSKGLLTVGSRDNRITRYGHFLRKYKLDELPQLFNVLIGDMSLVGPRPEVRKYVNMYTEEQLKVLSIKPGKTDYASIKYSNESELLGNANDPEAVYVKEIMPEKLKLNLYYIENQSFITDLKIILDTFKKIF